MIDTFLIIFEQTLLHIPLVIGAYISISLMKVPDLALESAYVFGAVVGSRVLMLGNHIPLSCLLIITISASCLGGACVGLISSCITQKGKIPPLLASIITIGLFHGLSQLIIQNYQSLAAFHNPLNSIGLIPRHPELIVVIIIAALVIAVISFALRRQIGYALAVYGNNSHFFNYYGISKTFVAITGIMISNALAGCSGYIFAQSNGFVELSMGFGKLLLCITALMLGKLYLRVRCHYSLLIPCIGTMSYFTLQQLLIKVGINSSYFTAIQAAIILILLLLFFDTHNFKKNSDNLGV